MSRDELALDFVMGALSPLERETVARDRLSDAALDQAIRELEADLAPMTGLAGTLAPPDSLFDRIGRAIERERGAATDKISMAFEEGEWRTVAPGIATRELWTSRTYLLRCAPGAVIRAHFHTETENLVVVSGDLVIGERVFRTGDWHSAPPGTDHEDIHTVDGCVLLIQHVA
ncbi:cupin domain-containing protein [Novosphingobium sp. JCM 18896]|uniref:cupin domain-containing protein n=1 Tax=Novosphingobium sp. JCM 18896 TaxID=2989731 RepID=UPI002223B2F7|nr:cupin domain-containing protein [Novosphingobium sp. JCM 18896]MCW1427813.1 cupin domain-containing protein [Novosphingobium sp. JCM 18896]